MLVTDYSSVYFDFLLLDRPILFAPFDLDEYRTRRNFYYEYDDVTPGPKARTWTEVMNQLDLVLEGVDAHKDDRKRVRDKFNKHQDAGSSARVAEKIQASLRSPRRS